MLSVPSSLLIFESTYPVCAITVRMVPPAELEAIVGDVTGQGLGVVPDKGIVAIGRVQIVVPILHIFQPFIVIFFAGRGIERISCGRSISIIAAVPDRSGGVGAPRGRSSHHDEDLHSGEGTTGGFLNITENNRMKTTE